MATVDPITLAVVQGVLESTQREMTLTIEKTSRSDARLPQESTADSLFHQFACCEFPEEETTTIVVFPGWRADLVNPGT